MKRSVVAAAGAAVVWAGMLGGVGVAAAEKPCVMPVAGGVAPCPPPIVSTNGDSIGGGANTDPVTMAGDAPSYSYEAPSWEKTPEPEPEPEPEEPTEETPAE
ncbi:hypothetical protein SEA_CHEESETOUCH_41 [Gordonia phage CheeseTouch]